MSYRILVAGAGCGGMSAAAILAKNGFDVTVVEKSSQKELGWDWTDIFERDAFAFADIPFPDSSLCRYDNADSFVGPSMRTYTKIPGEPNDNVIKMERRALASHLVAHCKKCGVKFLFGTDVCGPIMSGSRVVGLRTKKQKTHKDIYSDLVIDSAGINSPVRLNLPEKCGIEGAFGGRDVFYVWRGIFDRADAPAPEYRYTVCCYHMCRPGIDWIITDDDSVDILCGKFSPETQEEIDAALADFREHCPQLGNDLLRGGQFTTIPIRAAIPMLLCDGCAIIGDSAAMTVPMIGSGIANSLRAGKLLADSVMADKDGDFTRESLWSYQYRFFKAIGAPLVRIYMMTKLVTAFTPEEVDFLFENIVDTAILGVGISAQGPLPIADILEKAVKGLPRTPLMVRIASAVLNCGSGEEVAGAIPRLYDEKAIAAWEDSYRQILEA